MTEKDDARIIGRLALTGVSVFFAFALGLVLYIFNEHKTDSRARDAQHDARIRELEGKYYELKFSCCKGR